VRQFEMHPIVFKMNAPDATKAIRYSANSPLKFGFSVNHDFITLVGTVGLGKLDPGFKSEKGETRLINIQLGVIGRKVLADIYFQNAQGLYTQPAQPAVANSGQYYVRPDLKTKLYGSSVAIIDQHKKFSAQAAFLLDARQKKSAGSLVYGADFFYGTVKADSAFVPSLLADQYPHANVSSLQFFRFGPGIGYGHTFVILKQFFATAITSINADLTQVKEWTVQGDVNKNWNFKPNLNLKGAAGYNTENWGISFSYNTSRLFFSGIEADNRYLNNNDKFKLLFIQRIEPGHTIPKITRWGRKFLQQIGLGFLAN